MTSNVERGPLVRTRGPAEGGGIPWLYHPTDAVQKVSFTVPQASRSTGLAERRIWQEIRDGRLKAYKAGRCTVITAHDLLAWVNSLPTREPNAAQVEVTS